KTNKKPFTFHFEYIEAMKSKMVYNRLVGEFFDDLEINYEIYLNVFFDDPYNKDSKIKLDCETQLFAKFLTEMKTHIFKSVNFSEIGKCKLFITNQDK